MAQYLKKDSELGYIEDNAQIDYLKFNNLRHSVLGCMLGDFDETGAYVVEPEIVRELIEMPKYVVESYDNIELCKSILKLDKQIAFIVSYEGNRATLSLLEKINYEANFAVNSGTYSNINEYVLDYVETSGEVNHNVIYARWNIGNFGGNLVDIFNCSEEILEKYFGIVNRFKYLLNANKIFLEKEQEIEIIEAEYANKILKALKVCPNLEKLVLETVKQTLVEKKNSVSVNKPNFAKTFNEVLDGAIEKNINSVAVEEQEVFKSEQHDALMNLNINRSDVVEKEKIKPNENDSTPHLFRLRTDQIVFSKSVAEIAEEMLNVHKQVVENLHPIDQVSELIDNLTSIGLGVLVGVQEMAEEVVGESLAKTQANSTAPQTQKSVGTTKSGTVKSTNNTKTTGNKQAFATTPKTAQKKKSNTKQKPQKAQETQRGGGMIARVLYGGVAVVAGDNSAKDNLINAKKLSEREMLEADAEISKERQIQQSQIVSTGVPKDKVVGRESATREIEQEIVTEEINEEAEIITN